MNILLKKDEPQQVCKTNLLLSEQKSGAIVYLSAGTKASPFIKGIWQKIFFWGVGLKVDGGLGIGDSPGRNVLGGTP